MSAVVGEGQLSDVADALVPQLRERAARHDRDGSFVVEGFDALRQAKFFGAAVPKELGGGGASHSELCDALRRLAHGCPSTALAASMHSHLVAATVWKHLHGQPGEALLRRVAAEQLRLVSTGAGDWLQSSGNVERAEGGYHVTARKPFGSGSAVGDAMVTSAPYNNPDKGWVVLHFSVPFSAPGVAVGTDWDTLGMRGTGSQTITLERVFVPDAAIGLERPRDGWHPAWSVVITVAAPIYMAPYLGVAERARELALEKVRQRDDSATQVLVGEMENHLATARSCFDALVRNAVDYDFAPELVRANQALIHKTLVANAVKATVDKAVEVVGGPAFFRRTGIEQLFRDAQAGAFHPLPEKRQQLFSGRIALGLDPV